MKKAATPRLLVKQIVHICGRRTDKKFVNPVIHLSPPTKQVIMESLSQSEAGPPPPPPDPGPTDQERIDYITKTLPKLRSETDSLLTHYQEAGIKWHLIPFAVRMSHHNDPAWIDTLDDVFVVDTDGSLAECVAESFGRLASFLIEGQRAFDRGVKHLGAATAYTRSASYEVLRMEEKISMSEEAVADVIAVRNALDEQGLITNPEVWLDSKLRCFEDWLKALTEAEKGWIAMKS